jgi:hypothetical protein
MAVKAKRPKEAKETFGGVHAFHYNVTQCRPEQIPNYVKDIYQRVFGLEAPDGVHWWLLKRAVSYEIMYREGRLVRTELKERWERALKLDINLIEDSKERNLVLSLMRVEGARQDRPAVSELPSGKPTKGDTMATKKKAVKKTPAKKKVAAKKVSAGRAVGVESGEGIQKTWFQVFVANAKAKKADRMTDAEIAEHMQSEFPDSTSKSLTNVSGARRVCNAGGVKDCEAPAKAFVAYDEEGEVKAAKAKAAPAKKAVATKAAKKPAKKKAAKKAAKKK